MVSSRFGGKEENIKRAEEFCKYVFRMGHIPVAPHVYFPRFLNDLKPEERELGLEGSLELLRRCDEVWFFLEEDEDLSPGMKLEAELMIQLEMPYRVIDSNWAIESNLQASDYSFAPRFKQESSIEEQAKNVFKKSKSGKSIKNQFDEQDWHLIYYKDNVD